MKANIKIKILEDKLENIKDSMLTGIKQCDKKIKSGELNEMSEMWYKGCKDELKRQISLNFQLSYEEIEQLTNN